MMIADAIFAAIVLFTLAGALVTVLSGSLIYALLGLISTMLGIAGIYIYLNAPFIAMMQILIYVGAISILIAFAIMLAGPFSKGPKEWSTVVKFAMGLVVSLVALFIMTKIVGSTFMGAVYDKPMLMTTKDIGRLFYDKMAFPFELISLLIVVSIIGAVMLALFSKGDK
jgi:NADH-quinone oxidoreductase subunit J